MDNFIEANPALETKSRKLFALRQYLFAFTCLIQAVASGTVIGFTSVLFAQLKESQEIVLDVDQVSWTASITTLMILPVVLSSGWSLNLLGRKNCLKLCIILTLISYTLMYCAHSFEMLFASRFISGVFIGLTYPTLVTYVGEVMPPYRRPMCLVSIPMGGAIGVLLVQFLGDYLTWRMVILVMASLPIYNILIAFYYAESYLWLINKNRIEQARVAFTWFRGLDVDAKTEFMAALNSDLEASCSLKEKLQFCFSKAFVMPFLLTALLFITSEFSGDNAIIFYTSEIISIISKDEKVQYYSNLILNILRVFATLASAVLIRNFSVRVVLIASGYAMSFSLACIAIFLYLSRTYPQNKAYPIICLFAVIINVIFFALGLGPLPTVICGEMYPSAVRDVGGGLSAFMAFSTLFFLVKMLPYLFVWLDAPYIFVIFACCTFTGVTLMCFVLPNTRNKTLKELEKFYEK